MRSRIDSAIWEQRRNWIQKFSESGLSVAQFCRENDLNPVNFRAWRRKFEPQRASKETSRSEGSSKIRQRRSQTAFVQLQAPTQPSSPWVEVSMADGMIIRVPASNLSALQMVLQTLNSSRELIHA